MDLRHSDIELLGQILNERAGLRLASEGEFGLTLAMRSRMQTLGIAHSAQYLSLIRGDGQDLELHRLLPLVTVGKTDFFRDARQFHAVERALFPKMLDRARHDHRPLSLWSAACATGEEPYSLAMVAVECGALVSEVQLQASDINAEAIFEAERGVYSLRKLRPVSSERLSKFFVGEGTSAARVTSEIRRMVQFEVINLAEGGFNAPERGFDLIFCRNVLIYFDPTTMVRTLERLFGALAPGGYLALGYSESLYRIFNGFELVEVEGSFFYRKPEPRAAPTPPPMRPVTPVLVPRWVPRPRVRVTEELPAIAPAPVAAPPPPPAPPSPAPTLPPTPPAIPHRLARSVELIERGQFLEALDLMRVLVQAEPEGLTGWITLGNLLSVLRRFPEAFAAYERALQVEPLSAEARFFTGVAHVEAGRSSEAVQELSRSLFLDGEQALAYYYLGRAWETLADGVGARRAYKNCLAICQAQRPTRPYLAHYPDLPKDPDVLGRAAQYALGALH